MEYVCRYAWCGVGTARGRRRRRRRRTKRQRMTIVDDDDDDDDDNWLDGTLNSPPLTLYYPHGIGIMERNNRINHISVYKIN